jgi:hypothetical protein
VAVIRFVDLREADIGYRFAFFDTITDTFITVWHTNVWDSFEDFRIDWEDADDEGEELPLLSRFRDLCPPWALENDL